MSAPLVAGAVCGRPECGHGEDLHDGICFGTACECVRFVESAGPAPKPSSGGYPLALPWAALMDDEDRAEFLDELAAAATTHASSDVVLAEVEKACATWRLIAEAQHGHNTAPGPDALTVTFSPVASLREPEGEPSPSFAERAAAETDPARRTAWRMLARDVTDGEHYPLVHHDYQVSHDLPETGGAR